MAVHSANPGNIIYQECPYCKRIIVGIGPLSKHMRACKKKLCAQCTRPANLCYENMKEWCCECGETFNE